MMTNSIASFTELGSYADLELVAEGGAGRVYRARARDGARVALKTLHAERRDDPEWLKRFAREQAALRGLVHPNVVPLLDSGVDAAIGPYLVMPWLEGPSLRQLLVGGPLSEEAAVLALRDIARGLAAVHEASLEHRDLKPENVMLSQACRLQLVDFGLALHAADSRVTTAGAVAGSVPYLAPERIEGRTSSALSDVWSLGVVAFELCVGKRPFERASRADEVAAILGGARSPAAQAAPMSEGFAALIEACLAPEPAARPSAREVITRLDTLVDWLPAVDGPAREELLDAECADALRDHAAYKSRVGIFRVAKLKADARAALERRDHFGALRLLERAMAYRDDPEVEALLERAAGPRPASRQPAEVRSAAAAIPQRSGRLGLVLGGVVAVVLLGGGLLAWRLYPSQANEESSEPVEEARPIKEKKPPVAASVAPAPPPPPAGPAPARVLPDLEPLADADLPNDREPEPGEKDAAPPGAPLVDPNMFEAGSAEAALAFYDTELQKTPKDAPLRIGRALALYAGRRDREGKEAMAAVEADEPNLPLLWETRGVLAMRAGDRPGALAMFDRAVTADPNDGSIRRNRGILYSRLGRLRDAYADLGKALTLDPDDVQAIKELANIYDKVGKRALAAPLLRRLLRLTPRDASSWVDLSLAAESNEEKLSALEKALALAPRDPRAHGELCSVLSRAKRAEAISACDTALELAPDDPGTLNARGLAHYHQGRDKAALVDLDRAVALAPKNSMYLVNRYIVRSHAGMVGPARADLELACKLGNSEACDELKK
jgi:tetratricopeptide (TPR) repeat protein